MAGSGRRSIRGAALLASALVAGAVAASGTVSAHPQLLFGPEDEAAIAAQIQSGVSAQAYASMESYCWFSHPYDWSFGKCLEETAFRYRMSGDVGFAQTAAAALVQVASTDPSQLPLETYPDYLVPVPVPVAVAYDLVFDQLDDAERQAIVSWLEQYGAALWEFIESSPQSPAAHERVAAHAALGLVALAVIRESSHPDLATWLQTSADQLAAVGLVDAFNPGGAYDEGFANSRHAGPLVVRFAEAYRRETGTDLLAGSSLEETARWYAYGWLPHGELPAHGVGDELTGAVFGAEHLLLVRHTGDTLGKWAWHQMHGPSGVDQLFRALPISDRLPLALWYPEQVPTIADPMSAGFPLDGFFPDTANPVDGQVGTELGQGGLAVFRTGWSADTVALLVKVSDEWTPGSHNDSGAFMLSAFGADMAMDPHEAAGLESRRHHNVVQVGALDDDAAMRTTYGGAVERLVSSELAGYVRADGRYPAGEHEAGDPADLTDDLWTPVQRAERTVALLRGPHPFALVADDVSRDGAEPDGATWRMHLGAAGYLLSGTGAPFDPFRFEFSSGSQLVLTTVEPEVPAASVVATHPETWMHQVVTIEHAPAPRARFLALLQPLRSGVEEVPSVVRVAASGSVGAQLAWSDGSALVWWRFGDGSLSYGQTRSDARLLVVRYDQSSLPWGWLAAEATQATVQGLTLLDTGGLQASVSCRASGVEIDTDEQPSPRQIAAYGPQITEARLNGEPVPFVRAGSYVLLPASCAEQERCNGIDDDCDQLVDEEDAVDAPFWYRDEDGDGYGSSGESVRACRNVEGYSPHGTDCDDGDDDTHPGAVEVCDDGADNDCDGAVDAADPECGHQGLMVGTTGGCECTAPGGPASGVPGGGALAVVTAALCAARRRRRSLQVMRRT